MKAQALNLPLSVIRPLTLKLSFNKKILGVITLISISALIVFYIFQINTITKASFLIPNYQKEIRQLAEENKTLEITLSQINSLKNIETLVKDSNFEKVGKTHYIQVLEGTVVTK